MFAAAVFFRVYAAETLAESQESHTCWEVLEIRLSKSAELALVAGRELKMFTHINENRHGAGGERDREETILVSWEAPEGWRERRLDAELVQHAMGFARRRPLKLSTFYAEAEDA